MKHFLSSFRGAAFWVGISVLLAPPRTFAADLKPQTVQAWDEYVKTVKERAQKHFHSGTGFLSIDETPDDAARVRDGEIVVSPSTSHVPLKVPCGLIHDWSGSAFISNASLAEVLRVVRDYQNYKTIYHPNVVESLPISTGEWQDRFSLLLMNRSVVAKTALDSEYQSSYVRVDDQRLYSITESTRIQEIANYGTPSQHTLSENEGKGLIWRLLSITRYEERDGGVYIELEVVALSRDVPISLRWLIDPIVRRVSRSSLETSLQQTGKAVRSEAIEANGSSDRSCSSPADCGFAPVPLVTGPVHSLR
jgi:hypothetical protein